MIARRNLVRWILVVTLGCSLGLLLIFVVVSIHPLAPEYNEPNIYVTHQVRQAEPQFRISQEEMESELRRIIEAQLTAFRQDDYPMAYKYAATGIRTQLPLPAFERMVRQAYPLIAHSNSAQFGVVVDNGEHAVVNVTITGESGRSRRYQYLMQHESSGWRIGGVTEVKAAGMTI